MSIYSIVRSFLIYNESVQLSDNNNKLAMC